MLGAASLLLATAIAGCTAAAGPAWIYPPTGTPSSAPAGAPVSPARSSPSAAPEPTPSGSPPASPAASPVPGVRAEPVAVSILYYHRVIAPPRGFRHWSRARRERFLRYDVTPAAFEAQLDWLVARGYTTILPRDLAAYWDEGAPLPEHPVIITFDDGTHDWASTVLTLLRERGMIAEFYVTLQSIPSGGMSWRELRILAAAGNGIGAHGLHHRQLAGLPGRRPAVSEAVMRREVEQPRLVLAAKLGIVPDSYAYVGGGFDRTLRRLVREAGYTTARSILDGQIQEPERRYVLRVVRIGSGLDVLDPVAGTLRSGLPGFTRLMLAGDGG
jgi:peptidoglycan/xylan/chitin deacetylase (PgdA/CDA1 family)